MPLTLLIIGVSSASAVHAKPSLGEPVSALIFVAGITLAGALLGLASALLTALAATFLYNFYLAEPVLILRLTTGSDLAPLVVFNLCALVTGLLAGRVKDRAMAAARSNLQLASLLDTSRALQSAVRDRDIADTLARTVSDRLGLRLTLFRPGDGGDPSPVGSDPPDIRALALTHRVQAEDRVLRDGALLAQALKSGERLLGVVVIDEGASAHAQPAFVAALANLVTLALERASLSEVVAEARAAARTEELKTALLSSVSHDLRTPLTTISASASSLIAYRDQLDGDTVSRLLDGIVDECARLNRTTGNLLELSRLEAGRALDHAEVVSVSDVVGSVVQRMRAKAGARTILPTLPLADPIIDADATLFELVLVNLLENAILYSPDGTRIAVEVSVGQDACTIAIMDEGAGIPPSELDRVFRRFYRVSRAEPSPQGSGLGLAIAKGFVEALGGSIAATTPGLGGRGTRMTIRLPLAIDRVAA